MLNIKNRKNAYMSILQRKKFGRIDPRAAIQPHHQFQLPESNLKQILLN
jgi:hypothetical protein